MMMVKSNPPRATASRIPSASLLMRLIRWQLQRNKNFRYVRWHEYNHYELQILVNWTNNNYNVYLLSEWYTYIKYHLVSWNKLKQYHSCKKTNHTSNKLNHISNQLWVNLLVWFPPPLQIIHGNYTVVYKLIPYTRGFLNS